MGLDMFARVSRQFPDQPVDFPESEDAEPLHYWRKHPDLHGWFEQLYWARRGEGIPGSGWGAPEDEPTFNLSTLALTAADIDALEEAVDARALPHTEGFFFGESCEECQSGDREFIAKAREAIAEGRFVYYKAWW